MDLHQKKRAIVVGDFWSVTVYANRDTIFAVPADFRGGLEDRAFEGCVRHAGTDLLAFHSSSIIEDIQLLSGAIRDSREIVNLSNATIMLSYDSNSEIALNCTGSSSHVFKGNPTLLREEISYTMDLLGKVVGYDFGAA